MKVGIIGSGGREHAITFSLSKSKKIKKIFCIPGNAGTEDIATNIRVDINDFKKIKEEVNKNKIDLLIVGPEQPLVDGIVDFFQNTNIKVFGPNKAASQLEGSKIFTKKICQKYKIPTAEFGIFENIKDSKNYLEKSNYPIVIKADGLASGKGVYISKNKDEAFKAIDEIFNGKFGEAKNVLIEEFLNGEEMSFFIITDGDHVENFETAQDHKRVFEGDKGKNTGGMGAYSPSRLINQQLEKKILDKIIKPTLFGLKDLKINYKGFLYAGLMIKNNEPFLIEYNVRMGDPETQVVLPRIENDFLEIMLAIENQTLDKINLKINPDHFSNVVLASKGYPEKYEKGFDITGLNNVEDSIIFQAGTTLAENKTITNGGRVLSVVSRDKTFQRALKKSYSNIEKINFEGKTFRKDIGFDL